jgi:DNA-binding NtrC family response regulator
VRVLADRISALLAVSSALARSRAREIRATARADALDAERERLERILALGEGRHRASAERLARPVRAAVYGPAARLALEQIEQAARANRPVTVQAPLGVDTQGWCALAHLASPRKGGPFVVVDASQGLAHDLAHWQHPSESPLALADGGTLCLLHAASLPSAVQSYLLEELTQRAETARLSSVPSLGLVASVPAALHELVSEGRMLRDLARLLGDAEIPLPSLAERAEDLRAIILAALAGAGQQARGEPLGADAGALRLLIEHRWSGNDLELESVLLRAAAVAKAPLVCASDLEAIGFVSQEVAQPAPTPHVTERRITRRPRPPPA